MFLSSVPQIITLSKVDLPPHSWSQCGYSPYLLTGLPNTPTPRSLSLLPMPFWTTHGWPTIHEGRETCIWFFKPGFLYVALAILEFIMKTSLASNSEKFACFCPASASGVLSAEVKGVHHHHLAQYTEDKDDSPCCSQ